MKFGFIAKHAGSGRWRLFAALGDLVPALYAWSVGREQALA